MDQLETRLAESGTVHQIERSFNEMCSSLPENYVIICLGAINIYFSEAVELLKTNSPKQVCDKIKLC